MSDTKDAKSSKAAIVLKGSPLLKAHGAVLRVSASENHRAEEG
jgi:hypothetical protein